MEHCQSTRKMSESSHTSRMILRLAELVCTNWIKFGPRQQCNALWALACLDVDPPSLQPGVLPSQIFQSSFEPWWKAQLYVVWLRDKLRGRATRSTAVGTTTSATTSWVGAALSPHWRELRAAYVTQARTVASSEIARKCAAALTNSTQSAKAQTTVPRSVDSTSRSSLVAEGEVSGSGLLADVILPDEKIAIEIDGDETHYVYVIDGEASATLAAEGPSSEPRLCDGRTRLKRWLVQGLGWRCVHLRVRDLAPLADRRAALRSHLRDAIARQVEEQTPMLSKQGQVLH
ncbi:unnamed protein product [Amoebophrya sp. A25]|nr:unnamed protein product [Amoebophrya sp. A25]|eukprot:GSA25T00005432001.1